MTNVHACCTQELLHENEAMQVLGLSNYSHWDKAEQMRDCILAEPEVASEMLEFAKKRVRRFAHAGTTDMLHEVRPSARSFGPGSAVITSPAQQ